MPSLLLIHGTSAECLKYNIKSCHKPLTVVSIAGEHVEVVNNDCTYFALELLYSERSSSKAIQQYRQNKKFEMPLNDLSTYI